MKSTVYGDDRALAHALALIESGNEPKARGDLKHPDGPALGAFQIHQSAWQDISDMRARAHNVVHPYHAAHDPHVSKEYALTFINAIVREFRTHHRAPPRPDLLYACYSLGPSVIPRIKLMTDLGPVASHYEPALTGPQSSLTGPLRSIGYSSALARRKMATGERYLNLIYAHHESLRTYGIPILWQ